MTSGRRHLLILEPGPLTTVQDAGRPGLAHLGVGRSGAADQSSYRLANRLVGNHEDEAALEVTFGGLAARAEDDLLIAVTGAPCPVTVAEIAHATNCPVFVTAGQKLVLGSPSSGMRSYLAVRGGIGVPEVLGSRSTDILAGIGPDPLKSGDVLPIGQPYGEQPELDVAAVAAPPAGDVVLGVRPGPRDDWFTEDSLRDLVGGRYEVTPESNRVGMRLSGPEMKRRRTEELPSEGMVIGALQVPPSGQPTLFLADHPVTGGYPVIAVVAQADVDRAAQARPGQHLRFRLIGGS